MCAINQKIANFQFLQHRIETLKSKDDSCSNEDNADVDANAVDNPEGEQEYPSENKEENEDEQ